MFLILALSQKRTSKKRHVFNTIGLAISTVYLALTFLLKWIAFSQFEDALKDQKISYSEIQTRPAPFNTVLWSANVERENDYLMGNYSFFDTQPIEFHRYPKNHELLRALRKDESVQRMIAISKGWYTISQEEGILYFNDLRFGLLSMEPNAKNFVFKYKIDVNSSGKVIFKEEPKDRRDAQKLISDLWKRIKGN